MIPKPAISRAAAIVAVGEGAAEERGDDQRHQLGGAEQAGEEGRVGEHEDPEGQSDERRLGAEAGDQRTGREEAEVSRFAQRTDIDGKSRDQAQGHEPSGALCSGR